MATIRGMALSALIDEIEARNDGWTDRRVVQQANDAGHKLTTSDMSDYRHRGMRTIVPRKIIALGRGLHVPAYRVAIAVLSDAGIDIPFDIRTPEDAIAADTQLSASAKRSLLAILREDRAN